MGPDTSLRPKTIISRGSFNHIYQDQSTERSSQSYFLLRHFCARRFEKSLQTVLNEVISVLSEDVLLLVSTTRMDYEYNSVKYSLSMTMRY